jgi:hypothetical protein
MESKPDEFVEQERLEELVVVQRTNIIGEEIH